MNGRCLFPWSELFVGDEDGCFWRKLIWKSFVYQLGKSLCCFFVRVGLVHCHVFWGEVGVPGCEHVWDGMHWCLTLVLIPGKNTSSSVWFLGRLWAYTGDEGSISRNLTKSLLKCDQMVIVQCICLVRLSGDCTLRLQIKFDCCSSYRKVAYDWNWDVHYISCHDWLVGGVN